MYDGSASGDSLYNYLRDYDPAIGRYVESDPIGLYGGVNTYGYVLGDPLRNLDVTGELTQAGAIVVGGLCLAVTACVISPSCNQSLKSGARSLAQSIAAMGHKNDSDQETNVVPLPCPKVDDGKSCKADNECEADQARLNKWRGDIRRIQLYTLFPSTAIRARQLNINISAFNTSARAHNEKCPNHQVQLLSLIPIGPQG